jgi:putative ABC transport system substrate-binding protein
MRKLGYVEGRSILLEQRFPDEQIHLFDVMAADLVAHKVDVFVAVSPLAAAAAKRATNSIPIVFAIHPSPVESGLVTSLARPEGNITGLSNLVTDLSGKQLELFKEVVPRLSRIAILVNPATGIVGQRFIEQVTKASGRLNLEVQAVANIKSQGDFEPAFAQIAREGVDGVVIAPDAMFFKERARFSEFGIVHRLPVFAMNEVMVRDGSFLYYGPNFQNLLRGAASYVDRILKGARPGDLPVQQPTKFEFVINLRIAKAIGLEISPSLLARADEVIE